MVKKWLVRSALVLLPLALCVSLALNYWLSKTVENLDCAYQKAQAEVFPTANNWNQNYEACT